MGEGQREVRSPLGKLTEQPGVKVEEECVGKRGDGGHREERGFFFKVRLKFKTKSIQLQMYFNIVF